MYAVISNKGQQYRVHEGQIINLNKIELDSGKLIELDQVLMLVNSDCITIGQPYIKGAKVVAEIQKSDRTTKIDIIKFHRRKHSMKRQGHRQWFTQVKIKSINMV